MKKKVNSIILSIVSICLIGQSDKCFSVSKTNKMMRLFSIAAISVSKNLLADGFVNTTLLEKGFLSCSLCETHADLPKRLNFPLDCDPKNTCLHLYVKLGNIDETDIQCAEDKEKYQEDCCGENEPIQTCPPTEPPTYDGPVGNEPDCPICGTMEYPGIPNALIVARYVGEFSCAELYDRGLHGLIPSFICGPLQDFAQSVCGCGENNPKCIEDHTKCWGYVPEDTPAPTDPETPAPTNPFKRKKRPTTPKYQQKLSQGRGGAAGGLRGGHRKMTRGNPERVRNYLTEIE